MGKQNDQACKVLVGLQPAFKHIRTGESHLAQSECGTLSDEYEFSGLPEDWIVERDCDGKPIALHPDIVPGYWRDARFIAISQLNSVPLDS